MRAKQQTIQWPQGLHAAICDAASREGLTFSQYVRKAVRMMPGLTVDGRGLPTQGQFEETVNYDRA